MTDPHDAAALLLLQAVLDDLKAGTTYCSAHLAEEDPQGGFRLAVTVRPRPAEDEGEGEGEEDPACFTVSPGDPCPRCGEALQEASGTLLCPRCGPLGGQLPGV